MSGSSHRPRSGTSRDQHDVVPEPRNDPRLGIPSPDAGKVTSAVSTRVLVPTWGQERVQRHCGHDPAFNQRTAHAGTASAAAARPRPPAAQAERVAVGVGEHANPRLGRALTGVETTCQPDSLPGLHDAAIREGPSRGDLPACQPLPILPVGRNSDLRRTALVLAACCPW
jgi:hypothetical protein